MDAIAFVFRHSEGAMLSQKAPAEADGEVQKKVEVVRVGPTVVHEQPVVSRVSIGHNWAPWCTDAEGAV